MDSARWSRVQDLKSKVRALPAQEAHEALERDCPGDSTLVYLVENLLKHEVSTSQFLAEVGAALPADALAELSPSRIGTRVGPFVVEDYIDKGGQSEVYSAVRPEYGQVVALKFIRSNALSSEAIAAIEEEARTLARLKHDNIADFHGVERAEDGTPVLVIELVDGLPLDVFLHGASCRSLVGRLALFRKVCNAIESAHRSRVIHGDIKPSNIVVTHEGGKDEPRVVDFGIARRVRELPGPARGWTLGYAPPEQVAGEDIDERSDVYSLGVLLYELTTGASPFPETMTSSTGAFLQAIKTFEPDRPSVRLKLAKAARNPTAPGETLRRGLMPDLDRIILRALAPDAGKRYQSVHKLADDLDRLVELRPVTAHKHSVLYAAGKLLRRRRAAALIISSAVVVALLGYSWYGIVRQQLSLRAARDTERTADAQYKQGLFADALTSYQRALDEISPGRVSGERSKEDVPRILVKIGRSHLALAPTAPESEIEARRAIQALERAVGALSSAPRSPLLPQAHLGLGNALLTLAATHDKEGSLLRAVTSFRAAAVLTKNHDAEQYGRALLGLAAAHRGLSQSREPGPNLERAFAEVSEALLVIDATRQHGAFLDAQLQLALTETFLALQAGQPMQHLNRALTALGRIISEAHPDVEGTVIANALSVRAGVYVRVGNLTFDDTAFSNAEKDYLEALQLFDPVKNPKDYVETAHDLGGMYYGRAEWAEKEGKTPERIAWLEKARTRMQDAVNAVPFSRAPLEWGSDQIDLSLTLADLGEAKHDAALLKVAVDHGELVLRAFREKDDPQDRARADFALGHALVLLGFTNKDASPLDRGLEVLGEPMSFLASTHNLQRIGVFQDELGLGWYHRWQLTHRPDDSTKSLDAFDHAITAFHDYPELAETTRQDRATVERAFAAHRNTGNAHPAHP